MGLVTGVGMKVSSLLATLLNELNEDTATSGDCGDRRWAVFGPEPMFLLVFEICYPELGDLLSFPDTAKSFSLVCNFKPFSLSVNFLPLTGDTGVAGPVGCRDVEFEVS